MTAITSPLGAGCGGWRHHAAEVAATEQMEVEVGHFLMRVTPMVSEYAIPAFY
jgi:hypothetical protein